MALSVVEGRMIAKPDPDSPLYIENPLERSLNVAKNVSTNYLDEFQNLCRVACDGLENCTVIRAGTDSSLPDTPLWGLLKILKIDTSDVDKIALPSAEEEAKLDSTEDLQDPSAANLQSNVARNVLLNVRMQSILCDESDLSNLTVTSKK